MNEKQMAGDPRGTMDISAVTTRETFGSADTFMAFWFIVRSIFFLLVIFWLLWATYF